MNKKITFAKSKRDEFHFKNLKVLVEEEIAELPQHRKYFAEFRAVFFPLVFLILYLLSTIFHQNTFLFFLLYGSMGITSVLIFLNLVHEAVHENIFKKKWQNKIMLYFFDITGANSYIWKKRHKILHHSFQNIAGWDSDIEQADLFRIYPHDRKKSFHSYQHWFIFLFYPLYLVNWVFVRDFKDFFKKSQLVRKVCKIPRYEYIKLFAFKLFFIFYSVVVPILLGVPIAQAVFAMLFMIITAGTISLITLLTPHVNTTNQFPLPDAEGRLNYSWLEHQFATTNDVSIDNWITRNLLGNFNYHIAHHLFPNISAVYAPEVTKVIREYNHQHCLGYRSYPLKKALISHYRLIINNAVKPDILEESN